jgi:hypothetical protein
VAVKLTAVQVTKLPLWYKVITTGIISFANKAWTDRGHVYIAKGNICNNMLHVRNVLPIHKRQTHLLVRDDVI